MKRGWRQARGSTAVEFLAVLPFALFFVLLIWQMVLVAYGLIIAESTARDAARAASRGSDQSVVEFQAARNAAGLLTDVVVDRNGLASAGSVTVTVKLRVPLLVRTFSSTPFLIERKVTVPLEPGGD